MADTFTAILHLTLPEIGASDDTWGDKINDDFDIVDAMFGSSGEGTVIVRDANNDALVSGVNLTKAAGNARLLKIKSGTSLRWDLGADATAEGGSNAGSIFKINRYDDAGALLGTPFKIDRDTGLVTFASTPKVGGNDVLHMGNLGNIPGPIGGVVAWMTDAAPSGWLFMNGQAVSRTTYATLFALWGVTFGIGNGTTTFNLPDWREVVPVGKSTMGGVGARGLITHLALADPAAAPVGEAKHVQTLAELVEHQHDVFLKDNNHTHTIGGQPNVIFGNTTGSGVGGGGAFGVGGQNGILANSSNSSNITIGSVNGVASDNKTAKSGGNPPAGMNTVQPSVVCNWIVKAVV
ncbi:MAG: tail fiber protein [Bradyrhizobium sp.]|nr:tail fiber protein [Bradyrhizobium sp.]